MMQNIQPQAQTGTLPEKNQGLETSMPSQLLHMNAEENGDKEAFVVQFGESDPENPRHFSSTYKIWIAFQMSLLTTAGTLGAAIMTPASPQVAEYVDVTRETTSLVVALYMLGWAFGPMMWAPISETHGRRMGMLPAVFIYSIFSVGTAVSTNAASIFLTRFFGGIFASAPISNVPASLGDIYAPETRGTANAFVTFCISGGLTIGPVIGSTVTVNPRLGWRWTQYILAISVFSIFILCLICLPETYPPAILGRRAQQTRRRTGDPRYWHPHEQEKIGLKTALTKYFSRPLRMLVTEPIVTCLAFYASYTYGLLYLTVEVIPIVFREQRNWRLVTSTLPFLGMLVGVLFTVIIIIADQARYKKAVKKNDGNAVPEARLPTMLIGGLLLTTGLFWFGWTAAPKHHWALPVVAAGFIEAGFDLVYFQCVNFLVDAYGNLAASAVSANTILRSVLACGLAIAARPMFEGLGVAVSSSILGAISCLALPIPLVLMRYNGMLRKRSKMVSV